MSYNTHKMLHVLVSILDIEGEWDSTTFAYVYKEFPFTNSFRFPLPGLHDMLFESLTIIFRKSKKMIGISKLPLKEFLEEKDGDNNSREIFYDIVDPHYYGKADSYERTVASLGRICCTFTICENNSMAQAPRNDNPNDIFGFLFAQERAQMYRIAYEMFKSTQRGSFLCRIRWIIGVVSAEYYYNNIHGNCHLQDCDGTSCRMLFCKASYGKLPRPEIEKALEMLQYAAAAFANSLVTWRLEKPRKLSGIQDSRKKAILERLDIDESDLIVDNRGTEKTLSYIAFFSRDRLVLSFKGTTNGSETMHDLNCDYAEFQDGYAHRGIKCLAERFLDDSWEDICASMASRNIKKLVLTGQSLGAAASLLIYLVLQDRKLDEGISVEVICFAAPPVVSASIANRPFPNIKVYNYGHDIVTRLCFGSVLDLKYICISISSLYDYFTDKNLVVQKIDEIKKHLAKTEMNTKLYIPGILVHIIDCGTSSNPEYGYKHVNYQFFEDIICSRRAPFDHIIHRTYKAFKRSLECED